MSWAIQELLQQIFHLKRDIQLHEQSHISERILFLTACRLETQRKRTKAVPLMYHKKKAGGIISQHPYSSKNWN